MLVLYAHLLLKDKIGYYVSMNDGEEENDVLLKQKSFFLITIFRKKSKIYQGFQQNKINKWPLNK